MIQLTAQTKILIAIEAVDFRKQIDSLVLLCKQKFHQDPRNGTLFVFINRSRSMVRFLNYDGSGYWIATKRLSKGRYQGWPKNDGPLAPLQAKTLVKLIRSTACAAD